MYIVSSVHTNPDRSRHYVVQSHKGVTSPADFISLAGFIVAGKILHIAETYEDALRVLGQKRARDEKSPPA